MALVKCSECSKEISDKSTQCIHCGCPLENNMGKNVQTIEQTGKTYKSWQIVGSITCVFAVICFFTTLDPAAGYILLAGLIMYYGGKWGAWWHHG